MHGLYFGTPYQISGNPGINGTTGLFADGSAAAPSMSFALDTDAGFYRVAANTMGAAAGGGTIFAWNTTEWNVTNTLKFGISGRAYLSSASDGILMLANNAGTSFGLLQFGGTTSSYPALKRSGAAFEVKLADDSAYARMTAKEHAIVDGVTAPTAAAGYAIIYVDTADGDLKVVFGDGVVKTIVTDV